MNPTVTTLLLASTCGLLVGSHRPLTPHPGSSLIARVGNTTSSGYRCLRVGRYGGNGQTVTPVSEDCTFDVIAWLAEAQQADKRGEVTYFHFEAFSGSVLGIGI
jgi:hypothetical protein